MQRADLFDIKIFRLFQHSLYLSAILSNDSEIVPSCFASPVFVRITCAEFPECICREEYLFCGLVSHHDFRPVNHRCKHEGQLVASQIQCFSILDLYFLYRVKFREKLFDHSECLLVSNDRCLRIFFCKSIDGRRVIRFHVLHDKIVRRSFSQHLCQIVQPFARLALVDRVEYDDFIVYDHIGIICHTVWYDILTFKEIQIMIICSYIKNRFCYFFYHKKSHLYEFIFLF